MNVQSANPKNRLATAGMVLGIIGIFLVMAFPLIPVLLNTLGLERFTDGILWVLVPGLIIDPFLTIIGIVLSSIGIKSNKRRQAIAGLVLSIIGLMLSIFVLVNVIAFVIGLAIGLSDLFGGR